MIYTVTFNPSLDYSIRINDFAFGGLNRIGEEAIRVGGKGVNVSIVLNSLGVDNTALGFIAGFTGKHIESEMQRLGCTTQFTELPEGFSQIGKCCIARRFVPIPICRKMIGGSQHKCRRCGVNGRI